MKYKKIVAFITFAALISLSVLVIGFTFPISTTTTLYNNNIGSGINYKKTVISDATIKKVLNVVTCDLNNFGSNIIFSKAKDLEKKEEILSKQIQREILKGNNVVAGINGDMFDMGIGYSSGPQIADGAIITNHNAKYEENVYPVFGIDKNKKAFITYIHMEARLTLFNTTSSGINEVTNGGIVVTTNGAVDRANAITIDSINRENCKDKLVLDNYQLNQSGRVDLTPYISRGMTSATIVKGIKGPIQLGEEYIGTVEAVGYGSKSAVIPSDGVLLCSSGTKAQWMNNHLKPGDKIKIEVNYDKTDIKEAIGAYTYFLQNGRVLSNDEMIKAGAKSELVHARKARTAIGITADNRVIGITVDGGVPSRGISDGITLLEMANLLKSLGAVNGVGLDGGGSAQMNAKLYGEDSINIITKPSDGRERALTNGILFLSNNEFTYNTANISLGGDINIFKNTAFKFKVKGMDTNFNRLDLSNAAIKWTVDSKLGQISSEGVFASGGGSGTGRVTAVLGNISASAGIRVFNDVASLKLTDGGLVPLPANGTKQFSLDAKTGDGKPILVDNKAATWSVSGGIGTIDKQGLLTVTAKTGKGTVTAKVGSRSAIVNVAIMQEEEIIDNFEHDDHTRYELSGSIGAVGSLSKEIAKSGNYSYRISYDYDRAWDRKLSGVINLIPTYIDKDANDILVYYTSSLRPKKLGMWVYGDGYSPRLGVTITDGDGNNKAIDITKSINWKGWKYVDVEIPKDIPYPVTLASINFLETNKELNYKGDIYLDDIKFIYSNGVDLTPPTVSDFKPMGPVYSKEVDISAKISDVSGVDSKSIRATLDGQSIQTTYDEASGIINYRGMNLDKGIHSFEIEAMDKLGNAINPPYNAKFTLSEERDITPPSISGLMPANNSVVRIDTPRISFNIKDAGQGVDSKDINVMLDGVKLQSYFNEARGMGCAITNGQLVPGAHHLAITVLDRAGNKAGLQPITFKVTPITQPKDPNNFVFSILSDSHGTEFGDLFFNEVKNDASELIIQNGDLIDGDTAAQWTNGSSKVSTIKDKPVMASPGERETSSGSINDFVKYFGMPVYSFVFGNALFISLNSSIGQSITLSDPTQFDYLQRILEGNKCQNIFIYTHTPTRDNTGLNYAMPGEDTKRFENILADYKKANNDKNINVVFGHLHSFQSWAVNGVNYIVDGNECLKNYISPDKGGYMGYTKFAIEGAKIERKIVPTPQSIAIVDNSIVNGIMKVVKGTEKKLNLCGDFNFSSADYIASINNIKDVDVAWESDNKNVISLSSDGVMTAVSTGIANINAVLGNKKYSFKVLSMEQKDEYITGFKIKTDLVKVAPGSTVKIRGYGFDIYGNSYEIDSSLINWQASKGSFMGAGYLVPSATTSGAIDINAKYKNFNAKITLNISPVKAVGVGRYVKIVTASLNLRDAPSVDGKILGNLKLGDRIEVISEENNWLKVKALNNIGFIAKQYTEDD